MSDVTLHPPCPHCGGRLRKADGSCALCDAPAPEAPPARATDPLVGRLVADRFQIERLVGEGGMGRVYRANQVELDRPVALKVLHPSLATSADQKARFHREARAASRLAHPHSVVVYDFGEWEGQLYIAMEYLPGRTLAALLDAEWPLAPTRVVHLLAEVCDVLAAAHGAGMLHRDLKPENIVVLTGPGGEEQVKVVDFGLAILQEGEGRGRLTQEGVISGTPAYMSPEQCRGRGLDGRSDLYSLGVVLYELLSGEVPFGGDAPVEVLVQHLFNPPRPPSEVAPEANVDPGLEALALAALSKSPEERPADAVAFRAALRAALEASPATAREVAPARLPLSRGERADAAGLPRAPAPTKLERPSLPGDAPVVVVEPTPRVPASITTLLLANGLSPLPVPDLGQSLVAVVRHRPVAVVLDLVADPEATLAALRDVGTPEGLAGAPVVAVGDGEDLALMTRALQAGIAHFVPLAARAEKLPAVLDRLQRKAHRRRAREAAGHDPAPDGSG